MENILQNKFEELFKLKPEVVASAPGRLNFIGEHVDYCAGLVLPFAIDYRTQVVISRRTDNKIAIYSMQMPGKILEIDIEKWNSYQGNKNWSSYVIGSIWALGLFENVNFTGLNLVIDGNVPLGAGLSSSAALEAAVVLALNTLFELQFSLKQLALIAQKGENEFVGVPCGIMDQSISLMAKANTALLLDCKDLSTSYVSLEFENADLELLAVDTMAHHSLADGGYANRRRSVENAAAVLDINTLREITLNDYLSHRNKLDLETFQRGLHVVSEIQRVLEMVESLKNNNWSKVGELLTQSHNSLRDLYEVSCPELNCVVDIALTNRALGARMVGGGFGGSAIVLVAKSQVENIKNEIFKAFKNNNFLTPRFFSTQSSRGAEIEFSSALN